MHPATMRTTSNHTHRETWRCDPRHTVVYPEDLPELAVSIGAMTKRMAAAMAAGAVTVPIRSGFGDGACGTTCITVADRATAQRILADGGIDIVSDGGRWSNVNDQRIMPVFLGTSIPIPRWPPVAR
jgi:hypothetical protein